ncbi:hypothetical protein [Nocardia sp. SSK8]|uniref:hypothetical protein n=1 Tax=Nocardia sp. SSK8 TaxID=3120154 RepID=UPI00300ACE5A
MPVDPDPCLFLGTAIGHLLAYLPATVAAYDWLIQRLAGTPAPAIALLCPETRGCHGDSVASC